MCPKFFKGRRRDVLFQRMARGCAQTPVEGTLAAFQNPSSLHSGVGVLEYHRTINACSQVPYAMLSRPDRVGLQGDYGGGGLALYGPAVVHAPATADAAGDSMIPLCSPARPPDFSVG